MFIQDNKYKVIIENAGFRYYDFCPEKFEKILRGDAQEATDEELRSLIQTLYPDKAVCSGLFDAVLLLDIENGKRKENPSEAYKNLLIAPEGKESLISRILKIAEENKIEVHKS